MGRQSRNDAEGAFILIVFVMVFFSVFYFMWKGLENVSELGRTLGRIAILCLFFFVMNRFAANDVMNSGQFWCTFAVIFAAYGWVFLFHKNQPAYFDGRWLK